MSWRICNSDSDRVFHVRSVADAYVAGTGLDLADGCNIYDNRSGIAGNVRQISYDGGQSLDA